MRPETCPTDSDLLALHRAELPSGSEASVCNHVSACSACVARLAAIDDTDRVVSNLRQFLHREDLVTPDEYQGLEEQARKLSLDPPPMTLSGAETPPVALDEPLSTTQLGKYSLLNRLGRGGMGVVYAARHTRLDKMFAIKVILPQYARDPRVVARFHREARVLGGLVHPNIVAATDADEADGQHFLVMELIRGLNAEAIVRASGPLSVADACEVVRQAAIGLQYLHEQSRVHRDLKPSNLMLGIDGGVKILDLGLAAVLAGETGTGRGRAGTSLAMGTPDYMAPEQWSENGTPDIRADIYSLGCTLFKLLTGSVPFPGPPDAPLGAKFKDHRRENRPNASAVLPGIPEELDAIIRRMMALKPDDRFPTPGTVADALLPFVDGANLQLRVTEVVGSGPDAWPRPEPPTPIPTPIKTKTWRWLAIRGAAVVLCVAGLIGAILVHNSLTVTLDNGVAPVGEMLAPIPPLPPEKNQWLPLLEKSPEKIWWTEGITGFALTHFPAQKSINASVKGYALLGFGSTNHKHYRLEVELEEPAWTEGVGLFLGYRDDQLDGKPSEQFQAIYLLLKDKTSPTRARYCLQRARMVTQRKLGAIGVRDKSTSPMDRPEATVIPKLNPGVAKFGIEVDEHGLKDVWWNDIHFPEMVGPKANGHFQPIDYAGSFGAYYCQTNAQFNSAKVMYLER